MSLTLKGHVDYWIRLSSDSLLDMRAAMRSGRRTNALFCGHLAVEKILKALCAVRRIPSNHIWGHDLFKLANTAGLWANLSVAQQVELETITTFNIESRYDDYKRQFYLLCTKQYTQQWASTIETWCANVKKDVLQERTSLPNNTKAV